jgi:hypothetical protein
MEPAANGSRPRPQPHPHPRTAQELIGLVRGSGLVSASRLDEFLRRGHPPLAADTAATLVAEGLLTEFQAQLLLLGKWRGFYVGNYKVLQPLARGGMGRVYLCEHTAMGRRVAIKILSGGMGADEAAVERFRREARAAAALDHPNIVRAYDAGREGKLLYLVMEYIEGVTLGELVRQRGPLPLEIAVHSVRQVALGLQHAHQAGWVHRDIKPDNLLMTPRGLVKILDLGLARMLFAEGEQPTQKFAEKDILGTADYLAPEQIQPGSLVDGRADVYGLGATFYFLLTGRPPFASGSLAQKLMAHLVGDVRPVREVRPEVSERLDAVLLRMLAKAPDQRFPDTGAVVAALSSCEGKPTLVVVPAGERAVTPVRPPSPLTVLVMATPPAPPQKEQTPLVAGPVAERRPRRRLVVAALVVAAVVVLSVVGALWRGQRPVPTVPKVPGAIVQIAPDEAVLHILQTVRVEMQVNSTGMSRAQTTVFLNSEEDYQHKNNFAVVIPRSVLQDFRRNGVPDPAVFFEHKRIRVTGTITLYDNRPQIAVSCAADVEVIEP